MNTFHQCVGGPLDGAHACNVGVVLLCYKGPGAVHEYWRRDLLIRNEILTRYVYKGTLYGDVLVNYQGSMHVPAKYVMPHGITDKGVIQ